MELNIWYRHLCLQLQRSYISCSSWQGLHTLQQGFWPTPPYRPSPDPSGFRAVAGQYRLSAPSKIFYWVQVWRLARPLQDLEMLLTEPLLSCPGCVFRVVGMLEDPATTHIQCSYWGKEVVGQDLVIHGPIRPPLNTVQLSCPLCRKAPPQHDAATPVLHGWDGVLRLVSIPCFLQT